MTLSTVRGNSVVNYAACEILQGTLVPQLSVAENIKAMFNNAGINANNSCFYNEGTISYNPVTVTQAGLSKKAANNIDNQFGGETNVYLGGKYKYQLKYGVSSSTKSDNIVLYDVLEKANGSEWQGTFDSLDISSIKEKISASDKEAKCNPKIYYSTSLPENDADYALTNVKWTTTMPTNKKDIKAIAIDCSKDTKGNDFVLNFSESIIAYVNMLAGTDENNINKTAKNPVRAKLRKFSSSAGKEQVAEFLNDKVEANVTLYKPDLSLTKQSDPKTGTEKEPKLVNTGSAIKYTLELTNNGCVNKVGVKSNGIIE